MHELNRNPSHLAYTKNGLRSALTSIAIAQLGKSLMNSKAWMRLGFACVALFMASQSSAAATQTQSDQTQAAQTKATNHSASIAWQEWNAESFEQAQREQKFILLDLVAVWCHWCHVMDAKTYADPQVQALIEQHYVAVQADHDARPDLAERYRRWGWPATIVLTPDGREIVKRAGYIAPEGMAKLLQAIVDDPSPERQRGLLPTTFSDSPQLHANTRKTLLQRHIDSFDPELGGLKINQKFVDADTVEYDLQQARQGDTAAAIRARKTLDAGLALIDPAFGGAYQYSIFGDWQHPDYEKIVLSQARYLRLYAQAAKLFDEPAYRQAVNDVLRYVDDFLTAPNGAFYTSQDADVTQGERAHDYFALNRQQRLGIGIPRVDQHQYSYHNGLLIEALSEAYRALNDESLLQRAQKAARWIHQERRLWRGGYRHDQVDQAGPYLGDTLAMGRAFLSLYRATGDQQWQQRALQSAQFIAEEFHHTAGGLITAKLNGTPLTPLPKMDENLSAARFVLGLANSLSADQKPQRQALKASAEHILRYLATPEVALSRLTEAALIMADDEYQILLKMVENQRER